jgi:hypothetical protein
LRPLWVFVADSPYRDKKVVGDNTLYFSCAASIAKSHVQKYLTFTVS